MYVARKITLFFMISMNALFSMEEPFFIQDTGKWKREYVENILDIKKNNDAAYRESLQIAVSTLLDQDNFVKVFLKLRELGDKVDDAQQFITDRLGSEAITVDGRVLFTYSFPKGDDAFVAVLKYRDFLLSDYIFDVNPNEEVINEAVATLKSFSDETVNKLGKVLEGKLEKAFLMRAQMEAGVKYEDVKVKDAAWLVFFQEKFLTKNFKNKYLFFRYLKDDLIKRRKRFFLKDQSISVQERQNDQLLQAIGDACEKYKEKRLEVQQLYSFMVKELNKDSHAYYYDPTFSSLENKFVVGVAHKTKLLGTEEPYVAKKKRARKKSKKQQGDDGAVVAQSFSSGIESNENEEQEKVASIETPSYKSVQQKILEVADVFTHSGITQSTFWVKLPDISKNVVWCIYKMIGNSSNFALPEIKYSSYVDLWIKDPQEALSKKGYDDPNSEKSRDAMKKGSYANHEHMRRMITLYESFSYDCDAFILRYATFSEQIDEKTNRTCVKIVAPGHCEYGDKRITGLFVFIVDKKSGVCFHRMFEPKELNWQDPNLYQVNLELNFPPLSEI